MYIFRIVVLAVLAWFFIVGVKRGLIQQVLEVVGIIVAFLAAFYFAHALAEWIEVKTGADYRLSLAMAALAIFIGIIIGVHFIGAWLKKLFGLTIMGVFDRVVGGLFGGLKGVLVISLVLSVIMILPFPDDVKDGLREDHVTGAIYPVLPTLFDTVVSNIPGGAKFEQIARIKDSDAVRDTKKKLDNIKGNFEKSKERLEKDPED
ncbi:MAG: CvpA family protein [Candidatus Krumholzibacteria bacterium]|nr:CvpA family protein [Candidatus Krumholzibacteria bacterium]